MKVPPSTQAAEIASAYWGPTVATVTVVSSGPVTKISSISTESSAYALGISSGRSASSSGQRERSTDDTGGIAAPAANAATASTPGAASAAPSPHTSSSPPACANESGSRAPSPRQSMSLPCSGAPAALPSASAPAQSPAAANEPLTSCT